MPERTASVVREHGGGRQPVTDFSLGPNDKVTVEKDKDTGNQTVVITSEGAEADDAVVLRTHETVRVAPSTDKDMAAAQLENEGGVHVGVDPDGDQVDASAAGAGTAAEPTGPGGAVPASQTVEQGGKVEEQKAEEPASKTAKK